LSSTSGSIAIIAAWSAIGLIVGAAVAVLTSRMFWVRERRDHLFAIRKRDAAIDRLREKLGDPEARARQQEAHQQELSDLRHRQIETASELDRTRRAVDDRQSELEAARQSARELEARYLTQLEAERHEAAMRRAALDTELATARESTITLRAELSAHRETAAKINARLEADVDATRSLLERATADLSEERQASAAMRDELRTRLVESEEKRRRMETEVAAERRRMETELATERRRLEDDLTNERRTAAERIESVRSFIATLREQYGLAAAERDAVSREVHSQRARAEDAVRALDEARADFARALDEEHRDAVKLVSSAWNFVHNYPRIPEWWRRHTGRTVTPRSTERVAESAPSEASAAMPETEAPINVQRSADASAGRGVDMRPADYDIETELADAIAEDLRQKQSIPPGRTRRVVSAVKRGDEVLVVCDDGSAWIRNDRGWREVTPVPGTAAQPWTRIPTRRESASRTPDDAPGAAY